MFYWYIGDIMENEFREVLYGRFLGGSEEPCPCEADLIRIYEKMEEISKTGDIGRMHTLERGISSLLHLFNKRMYSLRGIRLFRTWNKKMSDCLITDPPSHSRIFDHLKRASVPLEGRSRTYHITEPYSIDRKGIEALNSFCDIHNLDWKIGDNMPTLHFPNATTAIWMWKK